MARSWHAGLDAHPRAWKRPDRRPGLTCGFCVEPPPESNRRPILTIRVTVGLHPRAALNQGSQDPHRRTALVVAGVGVLAARWGQITAALDLAAVRLQHPGRALGPAVGGELPSDQPA